MKSTFVGLPSSARNFVLDLVCKEDGDIIYDEADQLIEGVYPILHKCRVFCNSSGDIILIEKFQTERYYRRPIIFTKLVDKFNIDVCVHSEKDLSL